MPELKHTKVFRGGVSAPYLTLENRECSFHANTKVKALDFRFKLASKGGGTTSVLLQIGIEDLPVILEAVASQMPDSVGVFSECAATANKKNLEMLIDARKVQNDERARAKIIVEKLENVEEFISEKYYAAPVGEDEREAQIKQEIEEVISSLRCLS